MTSDPVVRGERRPPLQDGDRLGPVHVGEGSRRRCSDWSACVHGHRQGRSQPRGGKRDPASPAAVGSGGANRQVGFSVRLFPVHGGQGPCHPAHSVAGASTPTIYSKPHNNGDIGVSVPSYLGSVLGTRI